MRTHSLLSLVALGAGAAAQDDTTTTRVPTTLQTLTFGDVPPATTRTSFQTTMSFSDAPASPSGDRPTFTTTLSYSDTRIPTTRTSLTDTAITTPRTSIILTASSEPSPSSPAAPSEPDTLPVLVAASYSGSGCPQGTVQIPKDVGMDGTVFVMPDFDLAVGEGVEPGGFTGNCLIHLDLQEGPSGWQFGLESVGLSGLEYEIGGGGLVRVYLSNYFASGDGDEYRTMEYLLTQPGIDSVSLTIPEDTILWSPCGVADNIFNTNTRVVLEGEGSSFGGQPLMESFNFVWRQCGDDTATATAEETGVPTLTLTVLPEESSETEVAEEEPTPEPTESWDELDECEAFDDGDEEAEAAPTEETAPEPTETETWDELEECET